MLTIIHVINIYSAVFDFLKVARPDLKEDGLILVISQNLKQVPQNFKKTFDIGVTLTSQLMMSYMLIKKKV